MQFFNHLEAKALQLYASWYKINQEHLEEVEDYWIRRVKLIIALKERATIFMARASEGEDDG